MEEGTMRKLASPFQTLWVIVALISTTAVPVAADHPGSARPRDIQELQYDLERLDDSLAAMDTRDPNYGEFRDRSDRVREDVTFLSEELRRHQRYPFEGEGATRSKVAEIRRDIADLQADIDRSGSYRRSSGTAVPEGMDLRIRLDEGISSETARPEDRVEASLAQSVRVDGRVAIPAGARALGVVRGVERAHRPSKGGRLDLVFDRIYLNDGSQLDMRAHVVSLEGDLDETGQHAGIGAVIGGVLGAIVGGKKGAVIGAIVGGTGSVVARSGDDLRLPAGTVLTLRLDRPLDLRR
jgi:outer membrane lipoprotein SlyB